MRDALDACTAPPERLKKLLALGWSLATARARRAWAQAETADGAAGSAVAGIDVRGMPDFLAQHHERLGLRANPSGKPQFLSRHWWSATRP